MALISRRSDRFDRSFLGNELSLLSAAFRRDEPQGCRSYGLTPLIVSAIFELAERRLQSSFRTTERGAQL